MAAASSSDMLTNLRVYNWYVLEGIKDKSTRDAYEKFNEKFQLTHCISKTRLQTKLKTLNDTVKRMKKKQTLTAVSAYNSYMENEFSTVPYQQSNASMSQVPMSCKERKLYVKVEESSAEKKSLKRKIAVLEKQAGEDFSNSIRKDTVVDDAIAAKVKVEGEVNELKEEISHLEKQNEEIKESSANTESGMKKESYVQARKLNSAKEKINEMKTTIVDLRKQNNRLAKVNESLQKSITELENETYVSMQDLSDEKIKLQRKLAFTKRKLGKFSSLGDPKEKEDLENEVEKLCENVKQLNEENRELRELVSLLEKNEIVTFENGRYTNEVREVIMELLNLNVSMGKINQVITTVLGKLGSQTVDRLPSAGAKCRILKESLILAQKQVGEAMLEGGIEENVGNVLHGDGTTKFHRHFQNFQVTTKAGRSYSFGLLEVASGDVAGTMCALEEAIQELTNAIGDDSNDHDRFSELVASIKSTMSDLGPVNPGFNAQLQTLRESLLPKAIKNWEALSSSQKDQMKDMANFFCKLHLLANFASESDKVLKLFEKMMLDDSYSPIFAFTSKESCGVRLVRTACKAFHERGCDKSGVGGHFNSFLAGKNETSRLEYFIGNRFNILFYNAAAVYFHKEAIKDFVKSWPEPNNLLKAVNEDASNELFCAEIRALGIINKLVTGPLWRLIEDADNILSLSPHLFHLKMELSRLCKDASSIFNNKTIFDEKDVEHHRDDLYERLFEPTTNSFDILTQQCLEVLFHGILMILERQCVDQLPGGKYWNPSDTLKSMSQNAPATNKLSEADFGIIDLLVRTKPNASCQAMLAFIMWSKNGTVEWLNSLSDDVKNRYLDEARKNYPAMKKKYDERKAVLKEKKMEMILKKQNDKKEKESKSAAKKVEAFNNLLTLGVRAWISSEEATEKLGEIADDSEKTDIILAQLNFYKYVLEVKCPVDLFYKTKVDPETKKRVDRSWNDLQQSLFQVIEFNKIVPGDLEKQTSSLKCKEQRDQSFEVGKAELTKTLKAARMKRFTASQAKNHLPKLMENPDILVGKTIQHHLSADGVQYWGRGQVIEIAKTNKNTMRTQYSVIYEDEPGATHTYPLLVDLKNGDLIIFE